MSIYFAQRESDGLVKVGRSGNVAARMIALRSQYKCNLNVIHVAEGEHDAERQAHNRFGPSPCGNELFIFDNDMIGWQAQPVAQSFAVKAIRQWLDKEGRFLNWLSEQVGCHRNNISRALSGASVPTASTRKALADLTGQDIAGKSQWQSGDMK